MTTTVSKIRIEILVDAPLVRRVTELAESAGVTGYTLMPTLAGSGSGGRWRDDQVSGAQAKLVFVTITGPRRAEALIEALKPVLDSHGLMLTKSTVEVVRGDRF
ncbi:MAG: transcriptional regulator [Mesorhizobium sp.]|nr:transcriptional regulator [Mesorhizobium sp.]